MPVDRHCVNLKAPPAARNNYKRRCPLMVIHARARDGHELFVMCPVLSAADGLHDRAQTVHQLWDLARARFGHIGMCHSLLYLESFLSILGFCHVAEQSPKGASFLLRSAFPSSPPPPIALCNDACEEMSLSLVDLTAAVLPHCSCTVLTP